MLAAVLGLAPNMVSATSTKEADAPRNLRQAERLRDEQLAVGKEATQRAEQLEAQASRLAHERVKAAATLREAEAATADVAARIDELADRRRDAEQRMKTQEQAIKPLLPLIERLSLYPVETMLAVPESAESALRGVLVLKGLTRQVEQTAERLRQDKAELVMAEKALEAEAPNLRNARAVQARQAALLDRQIAEAHAARANAETEADLAASVAATAAIRMGSLRAVLNTLETQRRSEEAQAAQQAERDERQKRSGSAQAARRREAVLARPTGAGSIAGNAAPHGQLQAPVIGVVVKGWGEQTEGGPASGVSYHAPPAARVVSPCGGRVVFADNFRSYGLLLIVDCGGGYHVVLSGLQRLDVKLGQRLVAAEPVGAMASWEPGSTARRPALYVELRHDGQPVNPAPWLNPSS